MHIFIVQNEHHKNCFTITSWKVKDAEFVNLMNDLKVHTWASFVDMVKIIFGNERGWNYTEFQEKQLNDLLEISANMSIKVHFYRAIKKYSG